MNPTKKRRSEDCLNLDPKIRRWITIWIIVIATSQLIAINISLILSPNFLSESAVGIKILASANSVLIGTILIRVTRYYFPLSDSKPRNISNDRDER